MIFKNVIKKMFFITLPFPMIMEISPSKENNSNLKLINFYIIDLKIIISKKSYLIVFMYYV